MDSFEWNKIVGAILGTLLFVFIVKEVASITFHGEAPEEMAYKIEIPEGEAEAQGEEKPEKVDFGTLLQQANAQSGETVAKRCLQCHSFEKGGPNKTGPNLWGVLGRDIASHEGFRYSSALSRMDGDWTYEKVYDFVSAPSRWAPGTSMNFAGLRRKNERIDLLAYLRTQDDSPPPIPEPLPEEEETTGQGADAPAGEPGAEAGETGDDTGPAADGAAETGEEEKAAGPEEGGNAAAEDTAEEGEEASGADTPDKAGSDETGKKEENASGTDDQ